MLIKYHSERIRDNIKPFILIGVFVGVVVGKASWLQNITWLNSYLEYANINVNYIVDIETIISEHIAPNTLALLLLSIFVFSAIHRIIFGALERKPTDGKGIIHSLENFTALLAIAWLGLMIGIMFPAWFFDGSNSFLTFLYLSLLPVLYLVLLFIIVAFLHWDGIHYFSKKLDGSLKWKIGTRLEGLFVLLFALIFTTYHKQLEVVSALLESFINKIL